MDVVIDTDRQRVLFERIHEKYERHYYDRWSMEYRERYVYGPMFEGLDLNGLDVAEIACGSGHTSRSILKRFPEARPVGFDISAPACEDYRARVGRDAFQADLTRPLEIGARFDAAVVVGGIHHCVADLPATLDNIASMVKPGGWLLMMEPSRQCFLDVARRIWYRLDPDFDAETEACGASGPR